MLGCTVLFDVLRAVVGSTGDSRLVSSHGCSRQGNKKPDDGRHPRTEHATRDRSPVIAASRGLSFSTSRPPVAGAAGHRDAAPQRGDICTWLLLASSSGMQICCIPQDETRILERKV